MARVAIMACLLLSSCNAPEAITGDDAADRASTRYAIENPIGRYQMLPGGKDGEDIFLLDSRTGALRRCWFALKSLNVNCGDPSPAL